MRCSLKFWRFIHIWSGRIIVLFFLMWFVSGLVLIYHPYPKLTDKERYSRMPLYSEISSDSITPRKDGRITASEWLPNPIIRVDTLTERSQWVILPKYDEDLPIYRFYYDDPKRTELFVSGKTGEPVQMTTKSQRIWSYFGAIPHKIYIPSLRRNTPLWKKVVTAGGILCFVAALSGFIEGIGILRRRYKRTGKIGNPYRKWPMRLHFGFGICVGIFLITWGISGIFAMNKVPELLSPTKNELDISQTKFWGKKMPEDSLWRLTPENLKKQYPLLKSFEKTHFGNFPAIKAVIDDSAYYFAGNLPYPQMMEIPISAIEERVKSICGDSLEYTIEKSDRFTQYYMPRLRGQANLPVYEVKIADSCHSTIYIDPSDGYLRYITDHKRIRKWLFEGLHYWNINGLYTLKPLWTILIWSACMSCIVVCISGVIVTCSKVGRSFRKVKHLST